MSVLLFYAMVLTGSTAQFAALPPVATWPEIEAAAKACSVRIVRQSLPPKLDAVSHGPVYRFDSRTSPEGRKCFYQKLNMSEPEQVLREFQFKRK